MFNDIVGKLIFTSLLFFLLIISGCGEGYDTVWRMSVQGLDNVWEGTKHEKCFERHYIDPYTKNEFCLPEDFDNYKTIHFYRVRKND